MGGGQSGPQDAARAAGKGPSGGSAAPKRRQDGGGGGGGGGGDSGGAGFTSIQKARQPPGDGARKGRKDGGDGGGGTRKQRNSGTDPPPKPPAADRNGDGGQQQRRPSAARAVPQERNANRTDSDPMHGHAPKPAPPEKVTKVPSSRDNSGLGAADATPSADVALPPQQQQQAPQQPAAPPPAPEPARPPPEEKPPEPAPPKADRPKDKPREVNDKGIAKQLMRGDGGPDPPPRQTVALPGGQKATFRNVIKLALELAREQRMKVGKFRKDEKHCTMELYELLGLENDDFIAPPNELQLALREYTFPPRNMTALREVDVLDERTFEEILGPDEAKKRIVMGAEVGPDTRENEPGSEPITSGGKLLERLRRTAVSSEAGRNPNQMQAQVSAFKQIPKTKEQEQKLERILAEQFLFRGLDSRDLKVIFDALDPEEFPEGALIIEQGEEGDHFYIIDDGRCEISITDEDGENRILGFIGKGDSFGELALMYGTPRGATIMACTPCLCWSLDRETYRAILLNSQIKKRDRYMEFLDKIRILQSVDPWEKARIADVLEPLEIKGSGMNIVEEGTEGDTFYFIEQGEVVVSSRAKGEIVKLNAGAYFGELALMFSQPRLATVQTTGAVTHLVALNRRNFTAYLGPLESILKRNTTNYSHYLQAAEQERGEQSLTTCDEEDIKKRMSMAC